MIPLLGQFYLQMNQHRTIPHQIIIDHKVSEAKALEEVLSEQAGHKVSITANVRGEKSRYLALAKTNAQAALTLQLQQDAHIKTATKPYKRYFLYRKLQEWSALILAIRWAIKLSLLA